MSRKLTIIMYHYVRDIVNSRYPKIKGLDTTLFRQQLEWLSANYTFICTEDLLDAIHGGGHLPDRSVLLTFDDGYIDHYLTVFPLLKERNICGFFSMPARIIKEKKLLDVNKIHFILASLDIRILLEEVYSRLDYYRGIQYSYPSNKELYNLLAHQNRFDDGDVIFFKRLLQTYLPEQLRNQIVDDLFQKFIPLSEEAFARELYMNVEQIRLMKDNGMFFGIHGYDHYFLGDMNEGDMCTDLRKSLDVFDGIVDTANWVVCYPYGSYNDSVLNFCKKNGGEAGFTTKPAVADIDEGALTLSRLDTNDFPPISY